MTEDEEDIPTNPHWLVRNILQEHATDNSDWERKVSKWESVANTFVAQEKTKAVEAVLEDLEQDLIAEMYAVDMSSKIAQELAESQVTIHQGGDGLPYIDMFGVAQCAYTEARANDWREGLVKELAELIDKGIEARLGEIVARLEVSREESNGGIMNDMITDENNAIIDKCIRIVREL